MSTDKELMTVAEVADAADVTTQRVYQWIGKDGALASASVERFGLRLVKRAAVERFIAKRGKT